MQSRLRNTINFFLFSSFSFGLNMKHWWGWKEYPRYRVRIKQHVHDFFGWFYRSRKWIKLGDTISSSKERWTKVWQHTWCRVPFAIDIRSQIYSKSPKKSCTYGRRITKMVWFLHDFLDTLLSSPSFKLRSYHRSWQRSKQWKLSPNSDSERWMTPFSEVQFICNTTQEQQRPSYDDY